MLFFFILFSIILSLSFSKIIHIKQNDIIDFSESITCHKPLDSDVFLNKDNSSNKNNCFHPANGCLRKVIDGYFSEQDIDDLLKITNKGMDTRTNPGGPTILDINTGFIRDSNGLDNLFLMENSLYSSDEFDTYNKIIRHLHSLVKETFGVTDLYFTAPTFITRLDGREEWSPQEIHDEYWHPHIDGRNTEHYHYSGLLYLSDYGIDFEGGRLKFITDSAFEKELFDDGSSESIEEIENKYSEEDKPILIMEPKKGRVALFSSNSENIHQVERVTKGERICLSFWFTCTKEKEFEIFLDGKAHLTFGKKVQQSLINQRKRKQKREF